MLDVHAPEHRISEKRDFFVHLFTITCGLLIALGLENAAEALHHHHQRKEAEAQIREEIHLNLKVLQDEKRRVARESKDMVAVLNYVEARLAAQTPDASALELRLEETPLKDAAWRTASTTGVAQYMSFDTTQNFSECYKEQALVEAMQQRMLQSYLDIEGFVATKRPAELSQEELRESLPYIRNALSSLGGTRDIEAGMQQACQSALDAK